MPKLDFAGNWPENENICRGSFEPVDRGIWILRQASLRAAHDYSPTRRPPSQPRNPELHVDHTPTCSWTVFGSVKWLLDTDRIVVKGHVRHRGRGGESEMGSEIRGSMSPARERLWLFGDKAASVSCRIETLGTMSWTGRCAVRATACVGDNGSRMTTVGSRGGRGRGKQGTAACDGGLQHLNNVSCPCRAEKQGRIRRIIATRGCVAHPAPNTDMHRWWSLPNSPVGSPRKSERTNISFRAQPQATVQHSILAAPGAMRSGFWSRRRASNLTILPTIEPVCG